jgi:MFS family permease
MFAVFLLVETRAPEAIMPPSLFRNRVVGTCAFAAMLMAVAMFGATLFIPLFIQSVIGASATRSGAVLTPMMTTMVLASGYAGFAVTRKGKYKALAVFGAVSATIGLFLLSRLEVDTPPWLASVFMLVLGVGIGLVMQVIVLVVQNDAPPRDIGVATSTATFFRSMGGSLGVALFGAIFASRLSNELATLPPQLAARFSGGINISPEQVHALPPAVRDDFLHAFVDALQPVFIVGAAVTLIAFALACTLKEVPLRGSAPPPPPDPVTDPNLEAEYEGVSAREP